MAAWMQRVGGALVVATSITRAGAAQAQVVERFAVDQRGDFVLIGNTLARDCAAELDELLVGSVGECGENAEDSGADVLWSVAADGSEPLASVSVEPGEAASIAELVLPDGASVTRAELYWSAQVGDGDPGLATFGRGPAAGSVSAARTVQGGADGNDYYQSVADVTERVRELGSGPYRVSGIDVASPADLQDTTYYAGWWLLVFYALDTEPMRHLALYDGFGLVSDATPLGVTLTGFEVPAGGHDAKLGAVAFDGDASADGDQLRFGSVAPLGAEARLAASNNFFDSSRRGSTGEPFGAAGDRPRASGESGSMSGVDLHVVDVSAALEPGQTSAEVLATTTADRYFLSGLALSVSTTAPDVSLSSAGLRDLDGPPLRPGNELEYGVVVDNTGNGAAPVVALRAPLPAQVTYVPGSLEIVEGAAAGPLTDALDDDPGELELGAEPAIVVRLGTGVDGSSGGRLDAGERAVVRFRVALDPGASGSVIAQAQIGVSRAPGEPSVTTLTDADPERPGPNPAEVAIDDCAVDADCAGGRCDVEQSPRRCVACVDDSGCSGLLPSCDASQACVCVPAASEALCDGKDDDCDGEIDEGLAGEPCNAGDAACPLPGVSACDGAGGVRCDPVQPEPVELCDNGADDDCDGAQDADDSDCSPSGSAGASPASQSGNGPPAVDPRSPGAPVDPRGGRGLQGESPSAASLGGGGGCQLSRGAHGSLVPWSAALALTLLRRARERRGSPAGRATSASARSR